MNEIWKRLPDETTKAFAAFCKYRALDINGEGLNKRNLENVATLLNLKSTSGVEGWSRKYNWVERAAAWDEKREMDIIKVLDVDAVVARQAVTNDLMGKLIIVDKLLEKELREAVEQQLIGESLGTTALKRFVEIIEQVDTLKRRATGMPTVYTRERIDSHEEEMTFTISELDDDK